jgi:hypothetical protein
MHRRDGRSLSAAGTAGRDQYRSRRVQEKEQSLKEIGKPRPRPSPAAAERRARREAFARAMARSELGRHYWDETRQRELEAAPGGRGSRRCDPTKKAPGCPGAFAFSARRRRQWL